MKKTSGGKHILEQAIAQTIVFSLIQSQKHPEFLNHMVPNIVISYEDFQIFMYDAANDILLCSNPIELFQVEHPSLLTETVVSLWMVMHYRLFCSGLNGGKSSVLQRCKSGLWNHVHSKWDIYSKSLKAFVPGFPEVTEPSVNFILKHAKKTPMEKRNPQVEVIMHKKII